MRKLIGPLLTAALLLAACTGAAESPPTTPTPAPATPTAVAVQPATPTPAPTATEPAEPTALATPVVPPTAPPTATAQALEDNEAPSETEVEAETEEPAPAEAVNWLEVEGKTADNLAYLGNPDAPITIIDYSDFL